MPPLGHTPGLVYPVTLACALALSPALVHTHADTHAGVLRIALVLLTILVGTFNEKNQFLMLITLLYEA